MEDNIQQWRAEERALARQVILDRVELVEHSLLNAHCYLVGGLLLVGVAFFSAIGVFEAIDQGAGLEAAAVGLLGLLSLAFGGLLLRKGWRQAASFKAERDDLCRRAVELAGPDPD